MNRRWLILISISASICAIILIVGGIVINKTNSMQNKILKGIYINNIDVGGKTSEEATNLVEEKYNKNIAYNNIILNFKDKKFTINYKDINAYYAVKEAVDLALNYGKNGSIFERTICRWKLNKNKYIINLKFNYDEVALGNSIKKIVSEINILPIDATIDFDGANFKINNDKDGIKVDEIKLLDILKSDLKSNNTNIVCEIPIENMKSKITSDVLSKINTKISSFTTLFRISDANRTENIKIASDSINGKIVMPDEIFSMNKVLGPRIESKGYKDAPIIIDNKVILGLAGGICQATTTVYNAALFANLPIIERYQHGMVVSYIGPGRDATISGDELDLKFKNNYKVPIYIYSHVDNGGIMVSFYCDNERANQKVEITSDIYEKVNAPVDYINDASLDKGMTIVEQRPSDGIKVKSYRKVYENDKVISNDIISNDSYPPIRGIIRVGTK